MFCQQNSNCFINNCLGLKTDQLGTLPVWLSFAIAANSNPKQTGLDQLPAGDGIVASSTYSYQSFLLPIGGGVINAAQRDGSHLCSLLPCWQLMFPVSWIISSIKNLQRVSRTWKVLLNIVGLLFLVRPTLLLSFGFASYFQAFLYHHGPKHISHHVKGGAGCPPSCYFSFSFLYKIDGFTKRFLTKIYLVFFLIAILFWQLTSLKMSTKTTFVFLLTSLFQCLYQEAIFKGETQSCEDGQELYWSVLCNLEHHLLVPSLPVCYLGGIQGPLLPGHDTDSRSWRTTAHTKLTIREWSLQLKYHACWAKGLAPPLPSAPR